MAIIISYKVVFRANKITRDTEGYYIINKINGTIFQKGLGILNVYAPNYRAAKHETMRGQGQREMINRWLI